jgi:hypothetical protein
MRAPQLAQVLLRVVAIFIVWRTLEFGISQFIGFQYQMKVLTPSSDPSIAKAFASIQWIILISTAIPLVAAALLWQLAPGLSKKIIHEDVPVSAAAASTPLPVPVSTLLQVAGCVFIALAFANLPQIIYSFSVERLRAPEITVITSQVFPEALHFIGKIIVGGILILISKNRANTGEFRAGENALPAEDR